MQAPAADVVEDALERLLGSPQFAGSPRARRFLQFVVQAALGGRADGLKEYLVGVEVFDRAPSFDPRIDTIVRVEAVKLRKRVQEYYRGPGRKDLVIIDLPKGGYAPQFRLRASRSSTPGQSRPSLAGKADLFSVAVLPFANLSLDPDQEYWSDGLSDELTSALSRLARLRTVSRSSVFAFKGKPTDVREAGRLLSADAIVEGSVRMQAGRVRVAAQLTQVSTGLILWSDTIEREVRDAWAVQEEIAKAIVTAVRLKLSPEERNEVTKTYTANPEAFELYLKGRHALEQPRILLEYESADYLFQQALASDPGYVLPMLGLARTYLNMTFFGVAPPSELMPRAREILNRALTLAPDLAEAHGLMAGLIAQLEWNWEQAEQHFRWAMKLAPNSAELHATYAAGYLLPLGRSEEALAEIRLARELDPFSPAVAFEHPVILLIARRFDAAEQECRRILAQGQDTPAIRMLLAHALMCQGRDQEAAAETKAAAARYPVGKRDAIGVIIGSTLAALGDPSPAEDLLAHLERDAGKRYVPAMHLAYLHSALRRTEDFLSDLEQACRNREHPLVFAKLHFMFDSVREHPRFQAILRELHLA
jgi:TolB-like protein/Tfp pilus assembly protein PilF